MKIVDVVVLEEAADDLKNGRVFYDTQETGVGDYFFDSLLSDLESLFVYGGVHLRELGLYRMLAKRFPYAIYYEITDNVAYVVAVLPMRRDPAWIQKKLKRAKHEHEDDEDHF